jgi:hypothetical protein
MRRPDEPEQHMITPFAVNFQISLSVAFLLEARQAEQSARRSVLWNAGGLKSMQGQGPEGKAREGPNRCEG